MLFRSYRSRAELGRRETVVTALDRARRLRRNVNLGVNIDVPVSSLFTDILSAAGFTATQRSIDTMNDSVPFAVVDETPAGDGMELLRSVGAHAMFMAGNGVLRVVDRNFDFQQTAVGSYVNDFLGLQSDFSGDRIINDARISSEPRRAATEARTIGWIDAALSIPTSTTLTFFLGYLDPDTLERDTPAGTYAATFHQGLQATGIEHAGQCPSRERNGSLTDARGNDHRAGVYANSDKPIRDQWIYHAVADTVLANSLLRSLPEVDPDKVGVMGVSWGGIIVSTVMGIDTRFAFAIPVYGCGHLFDTGNHYERILANNRLYREVWDPIQHLANARMPVLWFSWPQDKHFPLGCLAASYHAAGGTQALALVPNMGHGQGPPEIGRAHV